MALVQLSPEEVQRMSVEEKDAWWLKHVYRGNMRQLTVRAAVTGMIIGGALSLTNLYVGAKTGWTLGVGLTSVILAFGLYKFLGKIGLGEEFTILENNAMQSVATSAGYMTAPLTSSLAAYMMTTRETIPRLVVLVWIILLAVLGVLFAFPLKRRFINDEQHPFPEGRAAGIVMDALHTSDPKVGMLKAKLLIYCGAASALFEFFKSDHLKILEKLRLARLALPEYLEAIVYKLFGWHPKLGGNELEKLSIHLAPEHVMFATGGLMGIQTGVSMLLGATINYVILAPLVISWGIVPAGPHGITNKEFVASWAVWPGVAVLTIASLVAFVSKPRMLVDAFVSMLGKKTSMSEEMRRIELPMSVFMIGIPVVGGLTVLLGHHFFGMRYALGALAIPLVFVFTLIAVHSTALTSITPGTAISKLTQLTYAALAPGNVRTNLITAGITGDVSLNASNLLMDIKPGYMLGAKPRQQAIGHVLGVFAGAVVVVPVFYAVFLKNGPAEIARDFAFPSAMTWKAVAELLTQGLHQLHRSAAIAAGLGALTGLLLELIRVNTRGRFPISPIGFGLGFLISWNNCFMMFMGSFVFWVAGRRWKHESSWTHQVIVQNQEPICGGIIAGGALMGILTLAIENVFMN